MGFMGAYLYADHTWTDLDPQDPPPGSSTEPWMYVHIFDSDITAVRYGPHGTGTGEAFLGMTPRSYFDDPSQSALTDPAREADGLAGWAMAATGRPVSAEVIRPFLAADDDPDFDEDTEDEAEIFVEIKSALFLAALGLPLPADLQFDTDGRMT